MGVSPQAQALVDAFAARGLSLSPYVAELWYGVERGSYHNLVGVTSPTASPTYGAIGTVAYRNSDGTITYLNKYPSDQAGAAAAAALAATAPQYRDLRTALTPGHSWQDQLRALIASPWNHGYYTETLSRYLPAGSGGGAPPVVPSLPSSLGPAGSLSLGDLIAKLSGGSTSANGVLDQPTITGLQAALTTAPPGGQPFSSAAAQIYLRFLQSLAGKNVPLTSVPVPKSVQDYLIAGGSGGWAGLGSTNPNTGQPEWPNPLSLGTELLPFLTFLADPVDWERIGFVALGLLAGTAGFVLYVRGHSGVRTA